MCILNMLVVTIISVWERRTSTSKIEIMGSIVSGESRKVIVKPVATTWDLVAFL